MNINPYLFSTYYYFKYFNKKKYHYIFIIIPLNFPILENCIAHNVPGWRRFGQVIGFCEANVPCPKCGWRQNCAEADFSPTNTVLRNPGAARMGGGTLTVCYAMRGQFQTILTSNCFPTALAILFKKSIVGL